MTTRLTIKTLLLLVGMVVGAVGAQLLWPLVTVAQGNGPEFILETKLPTIEKQMEAFPFVPPNLSPDRLQALTKLCGMQGQLLNRGGLLSLQQGNRLLWIQSDTGAMSFRNMDLLGKGAQEGLPSLSAAGSAADKFIQGEKLLPPESFRAGTETLSIMRQSRAGGPTAQIPSEIQISYGFRLGGKSVMGPGGKASLILGRGGEVAGFNRAWREIGKGRAVDTRSAEEAVQLLRKKGAWNLLRQGGNMKEIRIDRIEIAYWAHDLGTKQALLEPTFVFSGKYVGADGESGQYLQIVSAVQGRVEPTLPPSPPQPARQG